MSRISQAVCDVRFSHKSLSRPSAKIKMKMLNDDNTLQYTCFEMHTVIL